MRRLAVFLFVVAAVLALAPGWTGEARLPLLVGHPRIDLAPVALDPADPARRRVGALTFLDGVRLTSPDRAFGGFSALAVRGRRVTMLSDGGNMVAFTYAPGGRARDVVARPLLSGPGPGWEKRNRDSESMVADGAGGWWVGFENGNWLFRFAADGRTLGAVRPGAMRRWPVDGGPETLARLHDGRLIVIGELVRAGRGLREALILGPRVRRFAYRPPARTNPVDAALLPDGRMLVVNRRFRLPYRFSTELTAIPAGAIRPGAIVTGEPIATLDAPLIHDNLEGVAVTQEGGATIVWLVSDDNESILQRTLLLRFRLDTPKARRP